MDQVGDAEVEVITVALRRVRLALPGGPAAEEAIVWGPAGQTRPGGREAPG